ncbi:MAG: TonB family protein [Candidatus Omnitrophota bacterium]
MRHRAAILLARHFLVFALSFSTAPSVYPEYFSEEYGSPRKLDVVAGESKVLTVSNPKRVAIGNPEIADVAGASATEIIISAKAAGETNLQVWDDMGQREITIKVFTEDLAKLKKRLEDLFQTAGIRGITFQAGEQERKIFVLGDLPLRKKEVVVQLLGSFKDKIIDLVTYSEDNPLVEMDAQILEIKKVAIDKLGINWSQSLVFTESPTPSTHTLNRHIGDSLKAGIQAQFTRNALTATLDILEQDNLARTLARPKLVALSGKEAKFLVGGEVPILSSVSVTSGTTTTAVEYVDYGIKLNIKPEVKENGGILCKIEVEIKSIDTSTQLTIPSGGGTTTTPGFKTRNTSTELYLQNNQTIFLAGLINNEESNNLTQVPGLGDIPILGALFRSKNFQLGDTELVISITPRIVNYGDMRQDIQDSSAPKRNADEEPADTYIRVVQDMILKNVSYPLEAQRANLSGGVVLSLHLFSNGQLAGVVVNESSGHKLLDNAAIFTVKRLAPYPAFPKGLLLKEIWVEVPITYQLA